MALVGAVGSEPRVGEWSRAGTISAVNDSEIIVPLRFRGGRLELLEQTLLPSCEEWLPCATPEEVADAIRRLAVRGAPAIGVAAAWGVVLGIQHAPAGHERAAAHQAATLLRATRPTAVNLAWALDDPPAPPRRIRTPAPMPEDDPLATR